jgi:hypothetical protein
VWVAPGEICQECENKANAKKPHSKPERVWTVGTWGPKRVKGGLSYNGVVCNGDIALAPDGVEYLVLKSITAANPHSVTVKHMETGAVVTFAVPWEMEVSFHRSEQGNAQEILSQVLGAVRLS